MTDRAIVVVALVTVLSTVCVVFIAGFAWPGLLWASFIVCVAHALLARSTGTTAEPVRVAVPSPRKPSER